jgi:hypothetical protein
MAMPQISTCFLSRPIAFDAIDHQPVTVLMVLLSVTTRLHLTIMSKLSYYLRDSAFRHFLLSVPHRKRFWAGWRTWNPTPYKAGDRQWDTRGFWRLPRSNGLFFVPTIA